MKIHLVLAAAFAALSAAAAFKEGKTAIPAEWKGKSVRYEQKLGFTYAALDKYVLTGVCEDEATKAKIDRLHRINLHKLRLMPAYEPAEESRAQ